MVGAGYVLAGGFSRRLGRDKAFLEVEGITLVERAISTLQRLGLDVSVVCASSDQAGLIQAPSILDKVPGRGPVMGICTALEHSPYQDNWFHCCDMPLLPSTLFQQLESLKKGFDVVVPTDTGGRIQPLCGFYSRNCLELLKNQLEGGVSSILEVLKSRHLKVRIVPAQELQIDSQAFLNINDETSLGAFEKTCANALQDHPGGETRIFERD